MVSLYPTRSDMPPVTTGTNDCTKAQTVKMMPMSVPVRPRPPLDTEFVPYRLATERTP